ncbi:MAG: hypothetical protein WCC53_07380 [Thermoanaerobaculia bacterium]
MRRTLLITAIAFLFVGATSHAADFTLLVPVTIQNMTGAVEFRVSCVLTGSPLLQRSEGSATRTITGGAFAQSVPVEINAMPPGSAGLVTGYSCGITVMGPMAPGSVSRWGIGPDSVDATVFARVTRLPLREWRGRVAGTIP